MNIVLIILAAVVIFTAGLVSGMILMSMLTIAKIGDVTSAYTEQRYDD